MVCKKKLTLLHYPNVQLLNINKYETIINASFEQNSFSLKTMKETAKNLNINILIGFYKLWNTRCLKKAI